eukprot:Protomagalhaensia_wolfi_Nauph_80__6317@NODE_980_length_1833_cov_241_217949_g739_i0_p2_GENE_NODE_980_length_1833_cov_241_217949_g739_i0NODE_980_length_1833_cov_241_217949_g739_i0_p2_ORF_typecomplete_len138_score12_70_NODE_980_length_1833_cov_241_217949_g739_i011651578
MLLYMLPLKLLLCVNSLRLPKSHHIAPLKSLIKLQKVWLHWQPLIAEQYQLERGFPQYSEPNDLYRLESKHSETSSDSTLLDNPQPRFWPLLPGPLERSSLDVAPLSRSPVVQATKGVPMYVVSAYFDCLAEGFNGF